MASYERNVINYDPPISHNQNQTRYLVQARKTLGGSMKLLDVDLSPNKDCYFSALAGVYSCIERLQVRYNGQEIDYYFSPEALGYIIPSSGDNEIQKGIFSQLHGTNNNAVFNKVSKKLNLQRELVNGKKFEIRLALLSSFLASVGVIEGQVEIIIDWNKKTSKFLCPATAGESISLDIQPPFLSYETVEGSSLKMPERFVFTELVPDQWTIPAVSANSTKTTEVRSNAFNQKTLGKLLLVNVPQSIDQGTPANDAKALFSVFGSYCSVPMKNEIFNIALDGDSVLTFRNVSSDAIKLSLAVDAFGVYPTAVPMAHTHAQVPALEELDVNITGQSVKQLNGFFSYGCCEINQRVNKELAITYTRTADSALYPTLGEQMNLYAIGEVKVAFVNGQKVYL